MIPGMTSAAPEPVRDVVILRIAEGGMGYIELVARQQGRFSRLFARKRLHPHLRADAAFRAMFLDEARLAGLIRHPNVAAALEVGEDADGPFLLMDYVDGPSLAEVLARVQPREALLPVAFCVAVLAQAARGLHAAHELVSAQGTPLGVVHRDISPKNLLIGFDGLVRVADFGIAKARDNVEQTRVGVLKGNVGYMAPEYLRFQELDGRSDLFALGVVLHETLTRERLYDGDDSAAIARRILDEPAPDIFEERDVPPELAALLFELMAKDRTLRPPSALAAATRLEQIAADLAQAEGPFDLAGFLAGRAVVDARRAPRAMIDAAKALAASEARSAAGDGSGRAEYPARAAAVAGIPAARLRARRRSSTSVGPIVYRRRAPALAPPHAAAIVAGGAGADRDRLAAPPRARPRIGRSCSSLGHAGLWSGGSQNCALRGDRLACWGNNSRGQLGDGTLDTHGAPVLRAGQRRARRRDGRGSYLRRHQRRPRLVLGPQRPRRARPPVAEPEPRPARGAGPDRRPGDRRRAAARLRAARGRRGQLLGRQRERPARPSAVERDGGAGAGGGPAAGAADLRRRLEHLRDHGRRAPASAGAPTTAASSATTAPRRAPTPAPVPGADGMVSVAIANNTQAGKKVPDLSNSAGFICGVRGSDGRVLCWGNNYTGQLGDGSRENRARPTPVPGIDDAIQVAAGDLHVCALRRSGRVSCWGRNEFGAIGDGTMGPRLDPPRARRRAFDRGRRRHLRRRRAQLRAPPHAAPCCAGA